MRYSQAIPKISYPTPYRSAHNHLQQGHQKLVQAYQKRFQAPLKGQKRLQAHCRPLFQNWQQRKHLLPCDEYSARMWIVQPLKRMQRRSISNWSQPMERLPDKSPFGELVLEETANDRWGLDLHSVLMEYAPTTKDVCTQFFYH